MAADSAGPILRGLGLLIFFPLMFSLMFTHQQSFIYLWNYINDHIEMILMHLELVDPFNCVCDHLRSQTQFVRMRSVYIIVAYKVSKYREHTME